MVKNNFLEDKRLQIKFRWNNKKDEFYFGISNIDNNSNKVHPEILERFENIFKNGNFDKKYWICKQTLNDYKNWTNFKIINDVIHGSFFKDLEERILELIKIIENE